jgi:hypothetical protein
MQASQSRALVHAHREAVRPDVWERRLQRFPEPWRHRVRAVANEHARLRDLALSFPALLFAIAAPRAGFDMVPAIRAVIAGESLKRAAALALVPMWTRMLPPEAFTTPLPTLPTSPAFAREVANFVPTSTSAMPTWIAAIGESHALADEAHALWIAREFASGPRQRNKPRRGRRPRRTRKNSYTTVRRLCLWAWYSTHRPELVRDARPWSPDVNLVAAENSAWNWLDRLSMRLTLGDEPIGDAWFEPMTVDGFEFVPLCTATDLVDEAEAMRSCVAGYASALAENRSRLWSVRRKGAREATLELSCAFGDPLPTIYQLGGIENKTVDREISLAARRWMQQHEHVLRERTWAEVTIRPSVAVWRAQWRPYWLAKRRVPAWLPLTPSSHETLWAI